MTNSEMPQIRQSGKIANDAEQGRNCLKVSLGGGVPGPLFGAGLDIQLIITKLNACSPIVQAHYKIEMSGAS